MYIRHGMTYNKDNECVFSCGIQMYASGWGVEIRISYLSTIEYGVTGEWEGDRESSWLQEKPKSSGFLDGHS